MGEGDSVGEGDGVSSSVFFVGEAVGEPSFFSPAFFDDAEPDVDFLVVAEVFLVAAVVECVVVAVVSSLCAHETMKATPISAAVKPRTNFFIVNAML